MKPPCFRLICSLLLLCIATPLLIASDKTVKRKVLFLAGKPSHGYGAARSSGRLHAVVEIAQRQRFADRSQVYHYDWPEDAKVFDGVDCVVMYGDGGPGHMVIAHLDEMDALAKKGVGIVCLHYAVEVPKGPAGDKFLDWIGGYFETNWSVNPHWTAKFASLPDHPITRGVKPFEIEDEWYYHMRFRDGMQGVTPILTALPPPESLSRPDGPHAGNPVVRAAIARGEVQHMAWAVERDDGGRGFGFTGAHFHWNWSDPNFRKLVLNAIAWCAKVDVPRGRRPRSAEDHGRHGSESRRTTTGEFRPRSDSQKVPFAAGLSQTPAIVKQPTVSFQISD